MRIYMPYSDFEKCAKCFTLKRLTKMRHDVMQVLYMLSGRNHPSMGDRFFYNSPPKKVWGFVPLVLVDYGFALCSEYERRMKKPDPVRARLSDRQLWFIRNIGNGPDDEPRFLESVQMHKSHQAILARQDKKHYAQFGFAADPEDEKVFYWPVDESKDHYAPEDEDSEEDRLTRTVDTDEPAESPHPRALSPIAVPVPFADPIPPPAARSLNPFSMSYDDYVRERERMLLAQEGAPIGYSQSLGNWGDTYGPESGEERLNRETCNCPDCRRYREEIRRCNAQV